MERAPPQPLNYESHVPAPQRRAKWIRRGLITAAVLIGLLVLTLILHPLFPYFDAQSYIGGGIIGTPAAPITYDNAQEFNNVVYAIQASMYLIILFGSQWLLLRSRGGWRLDRLGGARLTSSSAIITGLIAMILSIGMLATLMELPDWWRALTYRGNPARQQFQIIWIVMAIVWAGWAWAFWVYGRNLDRYTFIGKVLRRLFAGTVIELVVSASAHVWVVRSRGSDCYCTRGSYTGVVFGMTALVWLFGPGVWLFVLREKRRREKIIE